MDVWLWWHLAAGGPSVGALSMLPWGKVPAVGAFPVLPGRQVVLEAES